MLPHEPIFLYRLYIGVSHWSDMYITTSTMHHSTLPTSGNLCLWFPKRWPFTSFHFTFCRLYLSPKLLSIIYGYHWGTNQAYHHLTKNAVALLYGSTELVKATTGGQHYVLWHWDSGSPWCPDYFHFSINTGQYIEFRTHCPTCFGSEWST